MPRKQYRYFARQGQPKFAHIREISLIHVCTYVYLLPRVKLISGISRLPRVARFLINQLSNSSLFDAIRPRARLSTDELVQMDEEFFEYYN